MSVAPSTTAKKGEIILQPAYFTSSIFVDSLREDILLLIQAFTEAYIRATDPSQSFSLFKAIWTAQGWPWLHLRTLDARSRDKFLTVVVRLFIEKTVVAESPLSRISALFGLYTFYMTQPSTSAPALHSRQQFPVPVDIYASLINLPDTLTAPNFLPLRRQTIYILSKLLDAQAFQILPASTLHPQNPRELPRELFVKDPPDAGTAALAEVMADPSVKPKRKLGRPTNRERARRTKANLEVLDKWLEKTAFTHPPDIREPPPGAPPPVPVPTAGGAEDGNGASASTHTLIAHAPTASRNMYRTHKFLLLDTLSPVAPAAQGAPGDLDAEAEARARHDGRRALAHANAAVLARLRRIDELAAQKGLEVGGPGGDRTGLERVERAVREIGRPGFAGRRGGILGLLEGGGMALDEAIDAMGEVEEVGDDDACMNVDDMPPT